MEATKPFESPQTPVSAGEEERRWERQSVIIPVDVTIFLDGQRSSFRGQASDISRGGMRLFLTRELPFGTSLNMEFVMPYNTGEFIIRGVVRNREGFTHGIEFLNPTAEQQHMIERTCNIFRLLS